MTSPLIERQARQLMALSSFTTLDPARGVPGRDLGNLLGFRYSYGVHGRVMVQCGDESMGTRQTKTRRLPRGMVRIPIKNRRLVGKVKRVDSNPKVIAHLLGTDPDLFEGSGIITDLYYDGRMLYGCVYSTRVAKDVTKARVYLLVPEAKISEFTYVADTSGGNKYLVSGITVDRTLELLAIAKVLRRLCKYKGVGHTLTNLCKLANRRLDKNVANDMSLLSGIAESDLMKADHLPPADPYPHVAPTNRTLSASLRHADLSGVEFEELLGVDWGLKQVDLRLSVYCGGDMLFGTLYGGSLPLAKSTFHFYLSASAKLTNVTRGWGELASGSMVGIATKYSIAKYGSREQIPIHDAYGYDSPDAAMSLVAVLRQITLARDGAWPTKQQLAKLISADNIMRLRYRSMYTGRYNDLRYNGTPFVLADIKLTPIVRGDMILTARNGVVEVEQVDLPFSWFADLAGVACPPGMFVRAYRHKGYLFGTIWSKSALATSQHIQFYYKGEAVAGFDTLLKRTLKTSEIRSHYKLHTFR